MFLSGLYAGDKITIAATNEKQHKVIVQTVVTKLPDAEREKLESYLDKADIKHYCVVEHMTSSEASINFNAQTPPIFMTVHATHDGKPFTWKRCRILRVKSGGMVYHIILNQLRGSSFDRREAYRLDMDHPATFTINNANAEKKAILRDISELGMGIKCDSAYGVNVGDVLTVSFVTKRVNDNTRELDYFSSVIPAKVVRVIPTTDKKVIVGCRMSKRLDAVKTLIYSEQRERERNGRR